MSSNYTAKGSPRRVKPEAVRFCIALLILGAGVVPAIALADEVPTSPTLPADLLHHAIEQPEVEEGPLTHPLAAEELPHKDLDREEAVELTEAVFDPILEDAVGPLQDLEANKYLSDHAAIVPSASLDSPVEVNGNLMDSGGGLHGENLVLLESTLPLLIDDIGGEREPVDLSLESRGASLGPAASLVEVDLPQELGEGIRLPDIDVAIDVAGAPQSRVPSIVNDTTAIYPNVAADTDFSVVPTPTGLETLTTLRSPDAPTSQTLELDLPIGVTLHQDGDGAKADLDGRTILKIWPPSAVDANGASVQVDLAVEGDAITLTTSPPPDAAYPILVDPLFESYDWYAYQAQTGQDTWYPASNAPGMEYSKNSSGLFLSARHEFAYGAGSQVSWEYQVPRLKAERAQGRTPTSFVQGMTLWHLAFVTSPGSFFPYMFAGIWGDQGWAGRPGGYAVWSYGGSSPAFYMNAPGNGMLVRFENGEPGKRDKSSKHGLVGLATTEYVPQTSQTRLAAIGAAAVEVGDEDIPLAAKGSISSWVNQTAKAPLTATAEDTGLGVKRVGFDLPYKGPQWATNSCLGTASSPCPLTWTASLPTTQYAPAEMPQGFVYVPIDAEDTVGNRAARTEHAIIKVDHTGPELALSGTLSEQAKVGTGAHQYTLKYDAADGDTANPAANLPFGTAGTEAGKLQLPMGVALDANRNIFVVDRTCRCVQKYDPSGKFLSQFGSPGTGNGQFSNPNGISISSVGNILVTDMSNQNVQVFGPSGNFIRKVTYGGFIHPYAVAAAPGSAFWVSDITADKVFAFREGDGGYLGTAYGSPADPNGAATGLVSPVSLAVDASKGKLYVGDNGLNRVTVFNNALGRYTHHFGSEGTGDGQFRGPVGIALAPSGNILVSDELNNRIQVFQPTGRYLRQFGAAGTANNQFSRPQGLAMGAGNVVYIADGFNKRIDKWSHADYDPQSGIASMEVRMDGGLVAHHTQPCETNSCSMSREWVLKADNYSVGQHKVDVTTTDGVGLATTKSLTVETHGDLRAPTIALAGSMTEQGVLGTTRPRYILKVNATDVGSAEERKSGVVSASIAVDGNVVDAVAPGCVVGGCSISREWILNAGSYAPGTHVVRVTATDGAGLTETKLLTVTIERDTTPPQLSAPNNFFTAPEGWVEQKLYAYAPEALDPGGYGVTSMVLRIDGEVVQLADQLCLDGDCGISPVSTINMSPYSGGSHQAELVARDGAGNAAKKSWTVNVAPDGYISADEATDTLEAFEATAEETQPVAPTSEFLEPEIIEAGDNPHFESDSDSIDSSGVPTSTSIDPATGVVTIDGADAPITITPVDEDEDLELEVEAGVAAVAPNVQSGVDRVVRPEYNGALFFTDIRTPTSAESFSWRVSLQPGQTLRSVDDQHAEIIFEDGNRMSLIAAMPARDATGAAVPTAITVSGSTITLAVQHKSKSYAYPVVAGQAFEVGYSSVYVELPVTEEAEALDIEEEEAWGSEPLSPEEFADATGWMSSSVPFRNSSKSVTLKQARRIARFKKGVTRVPPPAVASVGGPEGNSGGGFEHFSFVRGKACSDFDCSIWDVEFAPETQFVIARRATMAGGVQYAAPHGVSHCGADVMDWWSLNLNITMVAAGTRGPALVRKGSGEYLTFWCKYNVRIFPIPEVYFLENESTLVSRVYANGYQVFYAKARNTWVSEN
jgi:hypothetical protein